MSSSAALQSGSAYRDPDVALVDLTASSANAPSNIATMLNTTASTVSGIFTTEEKKIAVRTQVAEMQTGASKIKANSDGRSATGDELEKSCGPLAFLTDGYKLLEEQLGNLWDGIGELASEFAEDLGIAVDGFLGGAVDLANAVFEKCKELTDAIADAIANGLDEVAAALEASPLGQFYNQLSAKVSELTSALSGAISNLAQQASVAFEAALDEIEAFVDSLSLAKLFDTECANEAKTESMNEEQLSTTADVESALKSEGTRTIDPKATEAPAPFQERAEPIPEPLEPGPTLQSAINKYREAQLALDAVNLEVRNRTGRETSAQLASLKQRQSEANNRAMEAKRELNDLANKEGKTMSALPIWGTSYNQPKGIENYDPEVVAAANANLADLEKRYIAAVREFDRANAAQLAEKNSKIYNLFRPITPEDVAKHRVMLDDTRKKRDAVTAIINEIPPGDRATIRAKAPFNAEIKT